jgi:hypothetical protein
MNTTALVELTVEIQVGTWGDGCTLEQVKQQAPVMARERLSTIKDIKLKKSKGHSLDDRDRRINYAITH